jgi:hypothetical protein
MKTIFKLKYSIILIFGLLMSSCETTDLSILDDPNTPGFANADLDRYLNAIEVKFPSFLYSAQKTAAELSRVEYMFGRVYDTNYPPSSQDGFWQTAYDMMLDMKAAEAIATEQGATKHLVVIKVLKAYTLMTLVDLFGDIPFSQANDPDNYPFPAVDSGADVYAAAIAMLDEATALVDAGASGAADLQNDFYYDNDMSKWAKAANSMKMEAYLNTRLVDGSATSKFNAIVTSGNYISSSADDLVFQYGTNTTNPDTRHPAYASDYTSSGAGDYRSNWLMSTMLDLNDPRMKVYFYRQSSCTPGSVDANGNACDVNQQELPCSVQPFPAHFPAGMPYCSVASGYWGRDHGNAEGIPPDGLKRTTVGVYPAGGRFDNGFFIPVSDGAGGGGAGILPIMLASYTNLMIAEMRLASGDNSGAKTALEQAVNLSATKAISFATVDPSAISAFVPTATDISNYVSNVGAAFAAANANDKWEMLATQNFIAHYGNGLGAYNQYRRTGYPHTVQFNIEPNPGVFARSLYYPANEVNANSSISQKPNVGVKVFWDNNPDSPAFPVAN